MKLSITGEEKSDFLIQVPTWAGLTVYLCSTKMPGGDVRYRVLIK